MGFARETTRGTSPIASSAYQIYRFGGESSGKFPIPEIQGIETYFGTFLSSQSYKPGIVDIKGETVFDVNDWGFLNFIIHPAITSAGPPYTHTWGGTSNRYTQHLPAPFTSHSELLGGDGPIATDAVGCIGEAVIITMEINTPVVASLAYWGLDALGSMDDSVPFLSNYPAIQTAGNPTPFVLDPNGYLKFEDKIGDIDVKHELEDLQSITLAILNVLDTKRIHRPVKEGYPWYITRKQIGFGVTAVFHVSEGERRALRNLVTNTFKGEGDIEIYLKRAANDDFKLTSNNAYISKFDIARSTPAGPIPVTLNWVVSGESNGPLIEVKDNIATGVFYQ